MVFYHLERNRVTANHLIINKNKARGVVVALHSFNDQSEAFKNLGHYLSDQGFIFYAYDQRGFGNTIGKGIWPGSSILAQDLKGIAIILTSMSAKKNINFAQIDSTILSALAV